MEFPKTNHTGSTSRWKIEPQKSKSGKEIYRLKASTHDALGKGIKVKPHLSGFENVSNKILKKLFRRHKWAKVDVTTVDKSGNEVKQKVYVKIKSLAKQAFFRSQGIRDAKHIDEYMEAAHSLDKEILATTYLTKNLPKIEDVKTDTQRKQFRNYLTLFRNIKQMAKEKDSFMEVSTRQHTFTVWKTGEMYIHGKQLGEGTFKTAIRAVDIFQGKEVALLKLKPSSSPHRVAAADKEEKNLRLFQGSPYIVQLQKIAWETEQKLEQRMILELCNGGELYDWLSGEDPNRSLTEFQKITITQDIIRGVQEIHKKGMIHSDLKPGNFFLSVDPTNANHISAKVGDLGLMHPVHVQKNSGTPTLMSPNHLVALHTQRTTVEEKYRRTDEQKFKDEIYELGINLLILHFPKETLGLPKLIGNLHEKLDKLKSISSKDQIDKIVTPVKATIDKRVSYEINKLQNKSVLSSRDQMHLMILRTLQYDSPNQPSLEELDQFFTTLISHQSSENLPEVEQ